MAAHFVMAFILSLIMAACFGIVVRMIREDGQQSDPRYRYAPRATQPRATVAVRPRVQSIARTQAKPVVDPNDRKTWPLSADGDRLSPLPVPGAA